MVDLPERLPQADIVATVEATQGGFIGQVSAIKIAEAAFGLGAGRETKGDALDLAVGLEVLVKVGDSVKMGAPLVRIHANDAAKLDACRALIAAAINYSDAPVEPLPLFYDRIYGQ
jgi:thymidine phosphorylase